MPIGIYLRIRTILSKFFSPTRIFVLSFAAVILTGGLLLWLPVSAGRGPVRFVDALFTSTSAVCVTGLIVQDTPTYFSPVGQTVILCLIQLGGLGIMTFSSLILLVAGGKISMRERFIVGEGFDTSPGSNGVPSRHFHSVPSLRMP